MKHLFAGFIVGIVMAIAPSCGGTKPCNSTTCSTGCCDAKGECQAGTSNGACGQLGGTCQICQIAQACSLGTCAQTSGNGGGSGGGSGGGVTGGGGGVTGGGGGGGGVTGGGGGGGCDGCFFQGSCIIRANSNNNTLCGQGGVQCATCSGSQTCQNYTCSAGTTGGGGGTTGGGGGTTGGGGGTSLQPIGGACTTSGNCQAGLTCRQTTQRGDVSYPGGYCSKACTTSTECGGGGNECIGGAQSPLQFYGETTGLCVAACPSAGSQSTCRSGYLCEFAAAGTAGLCWLTPIPPFNGGAPATNTGVACTSDACQPSGTSSLLSFCFSATLPDGGVSRFNQGYCSADCGYDNTGTFCGTNGSCITLGTAPDTFDVCLANCAGPGTFSTCRSGYTCFPVTTADGGAGGVCYPACSTTGPNACTGGRTCNTGTGQCQ